MRKPNSYIRFLNLVELLNSKSKIRALDSTERLLLNNIMLNDQAGTSVFVGDLLGLKMIGSQATLHGRLKNLRLMGYVKLVEQDDARRKKVVLTNQAYKFFELLSKCMTRAEEESRGV
jgi:hypothetical protein